MNPDKTAIQKTVYLDLGGVVACLQFPSSEAAGFLRTCRCTPTGAGKIIVRASLDDLGAEPELMEELYSNHYKQALFMIFAVSQKLMPTGRCLMHGTAFTWRGRGYIFAGPSGVGKTTQYRHWKKLFGDEIEIINGDKPVLEKRKDGSFLIHPSPWQGKENYGSASIVAPLCGIIYLEQSKKNRVSRLSAADAAPLIWYQIFKTAVNEAEIREVVSFEEELLSSVPVWKLENLADRESVELLADTLKAYEKEETCGSREKKISSVIPDMRRNDGDREEPEPGGKEQTRSECPAKHAYIPHRDVVYAEICGRSFLIASRRALAQFPQMQEINESGAFCWKLLSQGMDEEMIAKTASEQFGITFEEALLTVRPFVEGLMEAGYICRNQ